MHKVSIVRCDSYELKKLYAAIGEAIRLAGGLGVVKGMRIVLKVNAVSRKAPERHATTHPRVIEAVARYLVERGACVVIGDSPGGFYNERVLQALYQTCGIEQAALNAGAALNYDTSAVSVSIPKGVRLKTIDVCKYLLEADAIISLGKLKTHCMTGFSGVVKNMFGAIPGTLKLDYHYKSPHLDDFADCLLDIAECVKPAFSILDGIIGMEGDGPTAGVPREVGVLIAGRDAHAVDIAGIRVAGMEPDSVCTVRSAMRRGLCPPDAGIEVAGERIEDVAVSNYRRATPHSIDILEMKMPAWLARMLRRLVTTRPVPSRKKCVGCGVCGEYCPAQAICMVKGLPHIDQSRCIKCYCCQELCPKEAMLAKKPLLLRLTNGRR
jgi:uncharacterized protein (DUF362 family)/NAD-dependent dihydropyrimidine dehydrogenase PreA subunit